MTTEPQEDVLRRIAAAADLTPAQMEAARRELQAAPSGARRPTGWLVEITGYVGGGLMLAGTGMYLAMNWNDLGRAAQVLIPAGVALALYAAALVIAVGGPMAGPRGRAVGVLVSLAPIPAAMTASEAATHSPAVWSTGTGLALGIAGLAFRSNPLGVLITASMSVSLLIAVGADLVSMSPLATGVALLVLGMAWAASALAGLVRPRPLVLAIGLILALVGAQQPLSGSDSRAVAYVLTLGVAAACLALYRWDRSLVALVLGVIGVTVAVPEVISDATNGAVSGPAIMLIAGVVLVGASAAGMALHRRLAPPVQ